MPSDSESSNRENFFIFKADEESVPGSTLIEDNAENEEILTLGGVQLLVN